MIWTVGHEEWGPRFLCLSVIFGVLSLICFIWPLIKRLMPISSIKHDMPISDAIDYLVNGSTVKLKKPPPPEIKKSGAGKGQIITWKGVEHQDARERIQTALNNGNIKSWGKKQLIPNSNNFDSSSRPIDQEYWKSACINPSFCFNKSDNAQTMALVNKNIELYMNLTLNKKEVKSLWPPSLSRKIFKRPRITY
jgi:hypothetical protein